MASYGTVRPILVTERFWTATTIMVLGLAACSSSPAVIRASDDHPELALPQSGDYTVSYTMDCPPGNLVMVKNGSGKTAEISFPYAQTRASGHLAKVVDAGSWRLAINVTGPSNNLPPCTYTVTMVAFWRPLEV